MLGLGLGLVLRLGLCPADGEVGWGGLGFLLLGQRNESFGDSNTQLWCRASLITSNSCKIKLSKSRKCTKNIFKIFIVHLRDFFT
jgi:hypothetical protein